jgi:hypothetical protein
VNFTNHRYILHRSWIGTGGQVNFVMLNPSTADDLVDDPTIRKCVGFAKRWGYSRMVVTNLFAYRATEPRDLQSLLGNSETWDIAKGGPENERVVINNALESDLVCCAWGEHGRILWQADALIRRLATEFDLWCIGITAAGKPLHPSRAAYTDAPVRFQKFAHLRSGVTA